MTLVQELERAVAMAVEATTRERESALAAGERPRTYELDVYVSCVRERIEHVKRLLANLEARTVSGSVQASVELGLANNLVGDLDAGSAPTKGER